MKRIILTVWIIAGLAASAHALPKDDVIFRAMNDEMGRTMKKLRMEKLQKPYFAAYAINDNFHTGISCSFGGVIDVSTYAYRQVKAQVRIGDSSFDSSTFVGKDYWNYRPQTGSASFEDDYDNLRFSLWDATDRAYKQALERFSQKKAYKESKMIKDVMDDLSHVQPSQYMEDARTDTIDVQLWRDRIKKLSAVFRKYPDIQDSDVNFNFSMFTRRFLDSGKTAFRVCYPRISIGFTARTQSKAGLKLSDSETLYFGSMDEIPPLEELTGKIEAFAEGMERLVNSSEMNAYIGPVIFEDQAAAEFFNQLLVRNVSFPKEIWVEEERNRDSFYSGAFISRLGMRVTSPFLSVEDDPLAERYNGAFLLGSYRVDDEGVPSQKVSLVRKGKLFDFYMGRAPVKDRKVSNGHGRNGFSEFTSGRPGNVFVEAEKTVTKAELKERLIKLCGELELDYCIIIRRMSPASSREEKALLSPPVSAFKVYVKDGREEPVHGIDFTGVSFRALRDVTAASGGMYVYNYYQQGPSEYNMGHVPASIITPSILVQEMEIKKTEKKPEKLPYLEHPYFSKK